MRMGNEWLEGRRSGLKQAILEVCCSGTLLYEIILVSSLSNSPTQAPQTSISLALKIILMIFLCLIGLINSWQFLTLKILMFVGLG
jgi:hypothetical protein